MQGRKFVQLMVTVAVVCALSACGFQLRGTGGTSLPESWKKMFLYTSNPNGELSREIQSTFSANDITWVDTELANYTLAVGGEQFKQRNLSINAQARASEFELTMSTVFSVRDAAGQQVIEASEATVVKQMENDPSNVVGKAEEVRLLKTEMRTELVQQILRRVGYFASSTTPGISADIPSDTPPNTP
ncbi:MAG: LPS assembly lipoprotein LptE [Halioglobus sp.]